MDLLQTCKRKFEFSIIKGLKKADIEESSALIFGTAVHRALEFWYSLPIESRAVTSKKEKFYQFAATIDEETAATAELSRDGDGTIMAFIQAGAYLRLLPENDKRSLYNGIDIMMAYIKRYIDDGLVVLTDKHGPFIERRLSAVVYEDDKLEIEYFGTIDVILQHKYTNEILVTDHKTTAALGSQFYNRINPNPQYTGYLLLAERALGLKADGFLVNGIQVAKTKQEFARQVTRRDDSDYQEFIKNLVSEVKYMLLCKEQGYWPQYAPNPCSSYGACPYLDICSSAGSLKEAIVQNLFTQ